MKIEDFIKMISSYGVTEISFYSDTEFSMMFENWIFSNFNTAASIQYKEDKQLNKRSVSYAGIVFNILNR